MARGGLTGIEIEIRITNVWRFDGDGRVQRWDAFNEDDEAEAAFLAE
jgi:hypothetical protein